HIMVRFFTVRDAKEASESVFYSTALMGQFSIQPFVCAVGAIFLFGADGALEVAAGRCIGG
ncbi:cation acetate symporter, partial [Klebsiella pneumoniae]